MHAKLMPLTEMDVLREQIATLQNRVKELESRAALDRATPAVPVGWKLVPVDPTQEMVDAMAKAWQLATDADDPNECVAEYLAAIAAAPLPDHAEHASPTGFDAEFLSKRLARVAKLAGIPMPDMTHEQIAGVAGTILGQIASKLEQASKPVAWMRDMQFKSVITEAEKNEPESEAISRTYAAEHTIPLCRCDASVIEINEPNESNG